MLENIEDNTLIITTDNIKKEILTLISKNKKIINVKFMTLKEFKDNYFGTYDEKALYYLIKKYNLKYDVAKEYLNNIFFNYEKLNDYYLELKENNLLKFNNLFKQNLKNIIIIGYNVDPYIMKELKKYDLKILTNSTNNYQKEILEFNTQFEEITYLATQIIEDLKKVNINDIYIVSPSEEYNVDLERIFKWFNIPLELKNSASIYSTKYANDFLTNLKAQKNLQQAIENLPQNEIYNQIIDILNKYTFVKDVDDCFIEILKNEFKKTNIKQITKNNVVKVISLDQIYDIDKHYYIIGFNQGLIPKIYQDNDLISDKIKSQLGIFTSLEKNKQNKQEIKNILKNYPYVKISYKLKDNYNNFYPSPLIAELNLNVVKEVKINLNYSHLYNKISLALSLDKYLNYNEKDFNLDILRSSYPNIDYQSYNNNYTKIDKELLKEYLENSLTLSYSSMNNYYLCPFLFYIKNILRLDPYEETFSILIGNLFHYCLSHIYDENFDLEKDYKNYLQEKELTNKQLFFLKKIFLILKQDIDIIKMQESHSSFTKHLTEKKIIIDKSQEMKINFMGVIDKISQKENYVYITDYKTGNPETTLDNINYGLNLQLPVYAYLIKKGLNKDAIITGLYLQKILTQNKIDSSDIVKENKDNLKLNGYTINDENIIQQMDDTYNDSQVIKSMKTTKSGFYAFAKTISQTEIDKLIDIVDKNIDNIIKCINDANFKIEPKRIDDKLISCAYCKYKDLCFRKEEDIKNIKSTKFKDILGDEDNA